MSAQPRTFLFAMFDSGGNVPPLLAIASELRRRGHRVRVLFPADDPTHGGPQFVRRVEAAGAEPAPARIKAPADFGVPPAGGLLLGRTSRAFGPLCFTHTQYALAPSWADAVAGQLSATDADVVAADHMLPGALVGAEAAGRPSAALLHTIYFHRPAPGVPPTGVGFFPGRTPLHRLRDRAMTAAIERVYRRDAVPLMNLARRRFRLPELRRPFEEYDRSGRVLILTSPAFDPPARGLPANVRYTGMPFDAPRAEAGWESPWPPSDRRPLVLVAYSTNGQGQEVVLRHLLVALGQLDVRALVTLGPAMTREMFAPPPNVCVVDWAPHDVVLRRANLLVTHGGHGTVMQGLRHGVPLLCTPLCCDQRDVGVRVVVGGLGRRLSSRSSVEELRRAIADVLNRPSYRAAAGRMAKRLATEDGAGAAADELERLAARRPAAALH